MIHRHAELGSTNDEACRLAQAGAAHGTVVQADRQTAGRGRLGRSWLSPPGNLYLSIILRPPPSLSRPAELGFVAALAVADAVDAVMTPVQAALKWPNDVLLHGAKVAGILMETADPAALIAGIGVNVASAPAGLPYPATALAQHGPVDVEAVMTGLLTALDRWWEAWLARGFAPIRQAWLTRGPRAGDILSVQHGATRVDGRFAGLAEDGALLLETATGQRRIVVGDVTSPSRGWQVNP